MSPEQVVEATLFASQSPLTPAELARADEGLTPDRVREALEELRRRYDEQERAFQVYQLGDGYQILTRPEYAPYLERFDSVPRSPSLSDAALETLAIVAYRQPIGRVEIEEVRGVGSASVLQTLQEWELIEVVGRGEGLGRPLLYGTTQKFLDHFGFQDLSDLPATEDISVTLRERPVGDEASEGEAPEGGGEDGEGGGGASDGGGGGVAGGSGNGSSSAGQGPDGPPETPAPEDTGAAGTPEVTGPEGPPETPGPSRGGEP